MNDLFSILLISKELTIFDGEFSINEIPAG